MKHPLIDSGPVLLDLDDSGVARLRLNRPEAANGMNVSFLQALHAAVLACHGEADLRVVVITGEGPHFCAGGDVRTFASKGEGLPDYLREATAWLQIATSALLQLNAPVIAAVHGYAAGGGGFGLVCAADIVVAAESARFMSGAVRVGMAPDAGVSVTLTQLVGLRKAMEILLTNPTLTAAEALDIGLLTKVVPDAELLVEALRLAGTLAAGAPLALAATKRLVWAGVGAAVETRLPEEARVVSELSGTADSREGLAAVLERRSPPLHGEVTIVPTDPTPSSPVRSTSPSGVVLVEDHADVRVLTLNRPEKRNAIDLVLRAELATALEAAMVDDRVRAVVVTGAGATFCSGGDISTMARRPHAAAVERIDAAARVIRAIWDGPKPVVAAVEGSAHGAGVALAIACDRVVSASDAMFATAFTRVGLAGDMGIFASLPARVGPAAARQLLMLPRTVGADEALRIGLVDAVAEPGAALAMALTDAGQLASAPPLALGVIKSMMAAWPRDPRAMLAEETQAQARLFDTDDFAEGIAAFGERRPPVFGGS